MARAVSRSRIRSGSTTRERRRYELMSCPMPSPARCTDGSASIDSTTSSRCRFVSPRPGEIVLDVESNVTPEGVPVAELRSQPEFIALRDQVRDAIEHSHA